MNCRRSLHVGRLLKLFRSERFCHSKKDRELISFSQRTHHCGELGCAHVGQQVKLCGWVQHNRMTGQFLALRDAYGVTQVTTTKSQDPVLQSVAKDLPMESVVMVTGTVNSRPEGQENQNMKTGSIEVEADSIELLGPCTNNLPFQVNEAHKVKESLRMEYRYLDFRSSKMQKNLRLRSQIMMKMREFLCNQHGFVDVETPSLFRRTPGGAREFVVPTHHPGHFYTLPQSPQQFKQLLMVGGIDRYMQVAKCFRDEGAKPDRQPEFTQVDLEMSFVTQEDIKQFVEHMILECWPEEKGKIELPFPRLSYQQAMDWYGSDKPDTRFGMKIKDITDSCHDWEVAPVKHVLSTPAGCVRAFCCPKGNTLLSNKDVAEIWNKAGASGTKDDAGLWHAQLKVREGRLQGGLVKHLSHHQQSELLRLLEAGPDDVIFILAGDHRLVPDVLGKARLEAASAVEAKGEVLRPEGQMNFLWVEDFPLFLPKEDGTDGFESAHHPFTAPHPDHKELLYTNPAKVKGQHYDLVLNGSEIGGGSIRINDARIQRYVLEEVLQEDPAPLEHLIRALEFGCPPHGGIALGLDRLLAIICKAPSIRDVIAFPKSSEGRDLMAKAPATITPEDYKYYHIKSIDDTQS